MIDLDLSPDAIARVTYILSRPMTALQFADAYWPDRVKRKPGVRSRGGHALLNVLIHKGLVRRKKSDKPDIPDTFIHASAQQAESTYLINGSFGHQTNGACYWVIVWREKDDWGWLKSVPYVIVGGLDDIKYRTTQHPGERIRYRTREAAKVALWKFRRDNPERGKNMQLVRVASM